MVFHVNNISKLCKSCCWGWGALTSVWGQSMGRQTEVAINMTDELAWDVTEDTRPPAHTHTHTQHRHTAQTLVLPNSTHAGTGCRSSSGSLWGFFWGEAADSGSSAEAVQLLVEDRCHSKQSEAWLRLYSTLYSIFSPVDYTRMHKRTVWELPFAHLVIRSLL